MKKQSHTFIIGGFALFAIYLYYVSATPLPPKLIMKDVPQMNVSIEEENALNYLNSLRIGAGLIPFQSQQQLNNAARSHADYLTNHLTYGHRQDKSHQDFTGEFASARVTHAGYATPQVIENVSTHNQNYKSSIDGLFAAIYHRFAFLDFRSDAVGIGISQNKNTKTQTAFVYNMSSNALETLYKENEKVNSSQLEQALNANKKRNKNVIIYPFDTQKEVPPAFFDELPDPLPEHRVSGFPISISFNSMYHKEAKLLNFQLFDSNNVEITNTLKFDHKTDPNKRLEKLDFVLFPLKRLEWNNQYHVKFLAIVDKEVVSKEWSFQTQKFQMPLHIVKNNDTVFKMNEADSHIFYFPPSSKVDLLRDIAYPSNVDIEFIDKNTIKLTALSSVQRKQTLRIGKHHLTLDIQNEY
ncbi:MAG: putative periplasmic protein [uncultured Sulfurovum sp.]|uniref:Putative periplasmic protein n=1 Tax=uncultured Sulfurovum sp. TaxID=269237 RepID=A0A6S6STL5_9BACT|nr:MAG: putative periplasmic protein [uncultured Sulfurovum sp.]